MLERAPAQVELWLTEPLEPAFSAITVLNVNGDQVDADDAQVDPADPTRMTVSLRSLVNGIYTVSWRALSTVDGHITSGAFPFAVGNIDEAELAAAARASQQVKVSFGEVLARWMQYISISAVSGGALFVLLVWQPAIAATNPNLGIEKLPWKRLAQAALFMLILGNLIFPLVQGGQVKGEEFAAPWSEEVGKLIFSTRSGVLWLVRITIAAALVGITMRTRNSKEMWLAVGLASLLQLTISIGSHAAAEPSPFFPVLFDWIHLLATSIWIGGLIHFVAGMRIARRLEDNEKTRFTANLTPRFTRLALASVGVLIGTGVYALVLRVGTLEALTGTLYGRTIIFKWLAFTPLLLLGALNLLGITPRLKKAAESMNGNTKLVLRFTQVVTSEVVLGVVVLLSVAFLTTLPPAKDVEIRSGLEAQETVEDLDIQLDIEPGQVGLNTYTISLTSGSQPLEGAREVSLRFSATSVDLPPSETILPEEGDGKYSLRGANLGMADTWQIQVVVRRAEAFDTYANFYFPVGVAATQTFPWHRVSGVLILAIGASVFLSLRAIREYSRRINLLNSGMALTIAVTGLIVFFYPPGRVTSDYQVNPIPPNADSLAAGEAVYREVCLVCHGLTGLGDGPTGISLNPRPADLSLHTEPGVHPDGRLFRWISEGFPNSVMVGFGSSLSEDERWNLVNYIRTFAED